MLEPLSYRIEVACDQKKAFEIFLSDMPSWWPLEKRSMSLYQAGAPAKALTVEAKQGGRIVEHAADGVDHHWGTITAYDPHDYIAMDFHMGLPSDKAGLVELKFVPLSGGKTMVELIHSKWENYGDMAEQMFGGYGSSWHMLFGEHFRDACNGA